MAKGLGRGFGALLPGEDLLHPAAPEAGEVVKTVPLDKIAANPHQPRKEFDAEALQELSESIREQGVIQPILVEKTDGGYLIVAGERRFRAAKMAGLSEIPVLVRNFTDESRLEIALIENIQRSDLTPLEEARAYRHLMEAFSLTQEAVSQKVGKQRSTVANALRLFKLPDDMLASLEKGELTPGHARALLSVNAVNDQKVLFRRIVEGKLSVREAEVLAAQLNQGLPAAKKSAAQDKKTPEIADLEQRLIDAFGTKVKIKGNGKKGSIQIDYFSEDDLNRIYEIVRKDFPL